MIKYYAMGNFLRNQPHISWARLTVEEGEGEIQRELGTILTKLDLINCKDFDY
jgi:hypothetical protein